MAKKSKSMIGHDPLAWLKDDAEDAEITEIEEKPAVKAKKKIAKKTTAKTTSADKKDTAKEVADDVFEIQSVQDISSVADLYEEMKELFKKEKVILDGQQVERIDAASLQLIYTFILEAKINDVDVSWRSPSEALKNSASLLGMVDALQLSKVA